MEFKGTKGKWFVVGGWDNDGNGCFPSVIIHGTEQNFKNNYGRNGITINVSHDQRVESLMANAQLIAHAPEMLDMLKKQYDFLVYCRDNLKVSRPVFNAKIMKIEQLIKEATTI